MLCLHSLGRFQLSSQFTWLLDRYGAKTLKAIHLSLACEDRQWALIRLIRLRHFPEGTHLLGM